LKKIYYLTTNPYDETEDRIYKHTNPIVKNIKRVSYFSTYPTDEDGEQKVNWRKNIDRIVIDADEGIENTIPIIQPILDSLNCEYWIIAGTDKKDKPYDSGSIVIMFNPVEGTMIREKFQLLVKCLNIHAGDVRNIGYMHKNPQWNYVHTFKKYGKHIVSFEKLYQTVFDHFNKSEDDVEYIYDIMSKDAYTNDLIDELSKEHPKRSRALRLYYRTHRDPDLLLSRLSTQRRIILLWSVSKYSPPNRTYTFLRIRLSTNIISLYILNEFFDDNYHIQLSFCVFVQS
jgi:hypothetical protein